MTNKDQPHVVTDKDGNKTHYLGQARMAVSAPEAKPTPPKKD